MTFAPKRILVPVSFEPSDAAFAEDAVSWGCDLAQQLGASLQLLHVCPPLVAEPALRPGAYDAMVQCREALLALARARLGELEQLAEGRGVACESQLLEADGSVPELIVQAAAERQSDLVTLPTHGRRGVRRLLLGSVAERVAHLSPVPVLLFPEPRSS